MNYEKLVSTFNEMKKENEKNGERSLDSMYISVCFYRKDWRLAKQSGAIKDCYYGWVLWSTSVNTNGSDLSIAIQKLASENNLVTKVRYL